MGTFYFGTDGLQLHRFYYTLNRTENYAFVNTIDAVEIMDNLGQVIVFPEKIFESYFCDFADPVYSVASLGPIDKDNLFLENFIISHTILSMPENVKAIYPLLVKLYGWL